MNKPADIIDLQFERDLRTIEQAIRDGIPLHEATDDELRQHIATGSCDKCRGSLSGPQGLRQLVVRKWCCSDCGAEHQRDINAARNILSAARRLPSVSGNELRSMNAGW